MYVNIHLIFISLFLLGFVESKELLDEMAVKLKEAFGPFAQNKQDLLQFAYELLLAFNNEGCQAPQSENCINIVSIKKLTLLLIIFQ